MKTKTIEERAKEYASKKGDISLSPIYNKALASIYEEGYIAGATEQKVIDDTIILKLKSAWEKEAQTNHDDEANYQQGYQDAIEKARDWFSDYLIMAICDANDWLRGSPETGEDRFRKAMEE